MPIYEYGCAKCGEISEVIQKVDDPAPAKCPQCGSKKLSRVVSRSSFQLKGGGWYSDLYSSSSNKAGTAATAAKPESKPEPKADKPAKPAKADKAKSG